MGITEQAIGLAAWEHELRGYHGRWARNPWASTSAAATRRQIAKDPYLKEHREQIAAVTQGEQIREDRRRAAFRPKPLLMDVAAPQSRATWATWGAEGDALLKKSVGHKAHMLRTHDVIVYGDAQLRPGGFGMVTVLMPAEIIKLRHHWERHGKRRRRYSDLTVRLPDGREVEQSMPDNSDIKLLPRPKRHRAPAHRAPPKPKPPEPPPVIKPEPGSVQWFLEHPGFGLKGSKPLPAPEPPKPVHATRSVSDPLGVLVGDNAEKQASIDEVQHGLDLQAKYVPGIVRHQVITFKEFPDTTTDGETEITRPGDPIEISPIATNGATMGLANGENRRNIKNDWWTPVDPQYTMADAVVAHEMGHVLAAHISEADMTKMWWGLAGVMGTNAPGSFHDPITGKDLVDADAWVTAHTGEISEQVSAYAAHSNFEIQGELWREYSLSAHPRPPAKFYGDWMLAHLPKYATR